MITEYGIVCGAVTLALLALAPFAESLIGALALIGCGFDMTTVCAIP